MASKSWSYQAHEYPISTFCRVEGTNYILTVAKDEIKLKNLEDTQAQQTLFTKSHNADITSIDASPSTLKVVSASFDQVLLTDMTVGDVIMRFSGNKESKGKLVRDCKFLSRNLIATCGDYTALNLADIRERPASNSSKIQESPNCWTYPFSTEDNLTSLGYSHPYISMGSSSGTAYILDLRNSQFIYSNVSKNLLMAVEQHPGNLSVSFDKEGIIRFYDVKKDQFMAQGCCVNRAIEHQINMHYVPELDFVINGSEEGIVHLWRLNEDRSRFVSALNFAVLGRVDSPASGIPAANTINHVDFDPAAKRLIASSASGVLHVWDDLSNLKA
ncbi:uncharacterized protein SPAPADRAFT_52975 [Spathaspora passalidarum NRRL Y-27907]|uniref:WD40 repeat-like protein n=1 Tax=Spathaspora passalidarum (strain NRRL Y-27907 / 11-Y1) TaxID=619300 RepID=G3AVC9_SPAPN|nr:uncharacterized protein SPAPADRAFT_52975 [Spathaspora passalidarum NRRL Y-27907]EGW30148.1 hypothetical protein SPAPADRAFT_52975 [Spathaspora passalidarum NRRL Y-27907]